MPLCCSKQHFGHSRAYLNFLDPSEAPLFKDAFDGRVFQGSYQGSRSSAAPSFRCRIEFAPNQRSGKAKGRRDPREGTIEKDADYQNFIERLKKGDGDRPNADAQLDARRESSYRGKAIVEAAESKGGGPSIPSSSMAVSSLDDAGSEAPITETALMAYLRIKREKEAGRRARTAEKRGRKRSKGGASKEEASEAAKKRGKEKKGKGKRKDKGVDSQVEKGKSGRRRRGMRADDGVQETKGTSVAPTTGRAEKERAHPQRDEQNVDKTMSLRAGGNDKVEQIVNVAKDDHSSSSRRSRAIKSQRGKPVRGGKESGPETKGVRADKSTKKSSLPSDHMQASSSDTVTRPTPKILQRPGSAVASSSEHQSAASQRKILQRPPAAGSEGVEPNPSSSSSSSLRNPPGLFVIPSPSNDAPTETASNRGSSARSMTAEAGKASRPRGGRVRGSKPSQKAGSNSREERESGRKVDKSLSREGSSSSSSRGRSRGRGKR